MNRLLIVLPLAALLLGGCGKDDPTDGLPPATQVGANTGGCLLDGSRFVAKGTAGSLLSNPIAALSGGFQNNDKYSVMLRGETPRGIAYVGLFVRAQAVGTYPLNQKTSIAGGTQNSLDCGWVSFSDSNELYLTDPRHTGRLTITLANQNAGISAGTFEFTAVSDQDSTKTIAVTHGRFDLKQ